MRKYLLPLVAAASLVSASSAFAATASGTFNVQVTIAKACLVSATAVNFGTLNTVLGTETANSTVSVTCNSGTAYSLSFVSGAAGLTATGNLVNGTNNIGANYSLGTAAASSGTGAGGTANTHTLTVGLSAAAYPAVGTYSATQTVYVNY